MLMYKYAKNKNNFLIILYKVMFKSFFGVFKYFQAQKKGRIAPTKILSYLDK